MNERETKLLFRQECSTFLDESEQEEIFQRLMEALTGLSKLQRRPDAPITIDEGKLQEMINELKTAKPVQYVLGHEWFCNLRLTVNENVLIPRPETEELVKWIIKESSSLHAPDALVLDIGTGSGCIALALKQAYPKARVMGYDISEDALKVARLNASGSGLAVDFLQADILDTDLDPGTCFNLIVSNPPYITELEKAAMEERVLRFEPHEALFVTNADPLQFYKAIRDFAMAFLAPQGEVFLELNQDFATDTKAIFDQSNFITELRNDMYGNPRMLRAIKKPAIQ